MKIYALCIKIDMKKIIILIILFWSNLSISQTIKVIELESKLAIPYATVKLLKNNKTVKGFYTDENGNLDLTKDVIGDKVIISCIGYNNKEITISTGENTIELEKKFINLNEVIVSNKKQIQIGYIDKPKMKTLVGVSSGLEIAVFIENELDFETQINTILFNVKKTKERVAIRVHLYLKSENELKPDEDLLHDNFIYYIEPQTNGLVEINLSSYNIIFPKKGVYVAIEGIGGVNTNTTKSKDNILKFESHKSSLPIYQERNQLNNVGWVNINEWLPENFLHTFNKLYDLEKLYVPSFGIKVSRIIKE